MIYKMSRKNKSKLEVGSHSISCHCEALTKASQPVLVLNRQSNLSWWKNFSSLVSQTLNLTPSTFHLKALHLALFFLLFAFSSKAQIYPVQVMPVLVPPYSLNTSDYYNGTSERLAVVLTNTDLQKPVLNVRLRMYIEGQNAKLQSRDGVYYPTITLDAGIPQRISLGDLAPYFNIDNLNFAGITRAMYAQNGKLPEGFYSFCFEVIEVNTGKVLSRKSCSMAYITLSDPPLLNLPLKGESIASRAVQNIIFQWTPRNLGSPNGAFNTEYEFTLKELWDTGIAPEAAFESTQPLYQVTVRPTTLLMGPAEPQLIPGKRYAWRIRAVSTSPTGEQADSYRNNGFSEIYWFTYQSDCKPPLAINSSVSSGRATINWTADPSNGGIPAGGYTLQYRERSLSGSKWYSVNTLENRAMLYDLKPGSTYEYRVGSSCVAGNIGIGIDQATYSDILTLEINGNTKDTATVNCGMISPEISITNRTPIQALNQGDLIMAGGFPVKLTKVTGGGSFSGEGYVTIPMLGQVNVKVRFSNIQVNTERKLFGGVIETTYDIKEEQIADTRKIAEDLTTLINEIANLIKKRDDFTDQYTGTAENKKAAETLGKDENVIYDTLLKSPYLTDEEKTALKAEQTAIGDAYTGLSGDGCDGNTITPKKGPNVDLLNLDDYSKCKEILARATKIKEYADKAKERETASKKLAEAVNYDKLVKWLIDNKGKVVAYDYTNFISKESISSTSSLGLVTLIPIDKSYSANVDGIQKTFHLKGNLSVKKGNVDLSANDKVYSSISILPNQDKIQYTLNYNYESSDERAIRLETNDTEEMEYLFIAQGFSYTEPYKKTVTDRFINELKVAGTDCDKIDYLYENIPSFVTPIITDEQKWTSLKSLLNCRVDKIGTDEGKAINNLIKGISTAYLKDKINTETAILMAVYAKLKMVDKLPFVTAVTKKISETWTGNEELSTVYPQETKIPGNENGQYKISCFGITNNDLTFGYTYFYLCRGLYSDTPCNGDEPGNKLFRFEDHCVNLFTLNGTAPVILESNGDKIILPAFIAGQIMQTAKEDKIDELRSFYAGLLLPELIVKPSTLTGWSRFLKGEGAVGEKGFTLIYKYGRNFEANLAKSNLTLVEKEIAQESYMILNSSEFESLIQAHKNNKSIEIVINGRTITYDDAPFSGMTYFEKNGFHIGKEAFKDEDEIIKTVLHEMHRLKTSKLRGTGSPLVVSQETKAAFDYAEKTINLFK